MISLLRDNPLLLFFLVCSIGFLLGKARVFGFSLGVAAVLFVGLFFGSLSPDIKLPDFFYQFGLVIFVYTIAVASGPVFFASLSKQGLRYNALVLISLTFSTGLLLFLSKILTLEPASRAGLFAGAHTNTPALAAVADRLKSASEAVQALPVTGFAVAYPMGVIGMMISLHFAYKMWGKSSPVGKERIESQTIRVSREAVTTIPLGQIIKTNDWSVVFSRLSHDDRQDLVTANTVLEVGDLLTIVGPRSELDRVTSVIGELVQDRLQTDRADLDNRRVFVSSEEVVGRPIGELDLYNKVGVYITRIRRGEVEFLPQPDSTLELGDQVKLIGSKPALDKAGKLFGDSFRSLSEIDIASFGVGIALGLLLGLIPFPMPGGGVFKFGIAAGPLIVGLILGKIGRSGPLLWQIPFSANLTLRQLGMIIFLAGIGVRSGRAFLETIEAGSGPTLFLAGASVTILVSFVALFVGHKLMKIPLESLGGLMAGMQTQPAVLAFASEKAGDDRPNLAYATVYPFAMLLKIIIAQILLG